MAFRAAVVGCGRIGSTIDDEHRSRPQFRYPWAHAPAYIEADGVELVAASDLRPAQLEDFKERWGVTALYTDFMEMVNHSITIFAFKEYTIIEFIPIV